MSALVATEDLDQSSIELQIEESGLTSCRDVDQHLADAHGYSGELDHFGKATGFGEWHVSAGGDLYVGYFKDGQFHGKGIYEWHLDGELVAKFEGYYEKGLKQGEGYFVCKKNPKDPSDQRLEHYHGFYKRNQKWGKGVYEYADGSCYDGLWEYDQKNGHGEMRWPNGDCYIGNFKDGARNGFGEYIFRDGRKDIGQFVNGIMEGDGKRYDKEGKLIEDGRFVKDVMVFGTSNAEIEGSVSSEGAEEFHEDIWSNGGEDGASSKKEASETDDNKVKTEEDTPKAADTIADTDITMSASSKKESSTKEPLFSSKKDDDIAKSAAKKSWGKLKGAVNVAAAFKKSGQDNSSKKEKEPLFGAPSAGNTDSIQTTPDGDTGELDGADY